MDLLTVREAAAMLRVSQVTLRRYVASGKLPAVRVGRNVRIERTAAEGLTVPTHRSLADDNVADLATLVPKAGFAPSSSIWRLVGFIDDDGPTDMATDKYKYFPQVYGERHEE